MCCKAEAKTMTARLLDQDQLTHCCRKSAERLTLLQQLCWMAPICTKGIHSMTDLLLLHVPQLVQDK